MLKPYTVGEIDKIAASPSRDCTKQALENLAVEATSCGNRLVYMLNTSNLDAIRDEVEELVDADEDESDEEDEEYDE